MTRTLLLTVAALALLVGCVDPRARSATPTPIATPIATRMTAADYNNPLFRIPTPTPYPTPTPVAGPAPSIVREVIAAASARDEERFRSLMSWPEVPCLRPDPTFNDVVGPTPLCDSADVTGTPYRVFYYSNTHGFAIREAELMRYFPAGFLGTFVRVEAAALLSRRTGHPEEKYVIGFAVEGKRSFRVFLDDRGIRRLHTYIEPIESYGPLFDLN